MIDTTIILPGANVANMPHEDLLIEGESAVITAGGSGIGRQIADHLTQAGVNIVINDIDEDALANVEDGLATNEGEVYTLLGNAANPEDTDQLIEKAVDEFGGLDIVVNNVGIAGPTKPCENITNDEFMQTLRVNVGGAFNTTRAAIPYLRESNHGRIVNLSSMSGKRPLRDRTPYTSSKMGIIGLTRTLAVELARDNVNVNAICPGSVKGPRLDAVIEGQAKSQGRPVEEVEEEFRGVSPMDQFVKAEDIADTVLYLCSTRASKVTGQDVNVTAGVCMY
ncbi:SDR family NAD(P)-dependent oxidoreductase [Haladaptatus sp. CMAA 1909]|uniref:SDR family NAD(P)-dependent oxidoreductase n=2 Tax=unclassified Haladaptatus TaxID=2622732 RepID=UPI003754F666